MVAHGHVGYTLRRGEAAAGETGRRCLVNKQTGRWATRTPLRSQLSPRGFLLYIELLALDGPSAVGEMCQRLADGPDLLLPLLELAAVLKVSGG